MMTFPATFLDQWKEKLSFQRTALLSPPARAAKADTNATGNNKKKLASSTPIPAGDDSSSSSLASFFDFDFFAVLTDILEGR
jgi:hypothetical protein